MDDAKPTAIDMTADIVSAYVGANTVAASDLPDLIKSVHVALTSVASARTKVRAPAPALPICKSIAPDVLICLEDGRKFKA
jgi:predicted transcriptional regulator